MSSTAIKLDMTRSDAPLDRDFHRLLNQILREPRTPLTAHVCQELQTSLQVKQDRQRFEAVRARIKANRRHIAKVDRQLRGRSKATGSVQETQYRPQNPLPRRDETNATDPRRYSSSAARVADQQPTAMMDSQAREAHFRSQERILRARETTIATAEARLRAWEADLATREAELSRREQALLRPTVGEG